LKEAENLLGLGWKKARDSLLGRTLTVFRFGLEIYSLHLDWDKFGHF